MADRVDGCEICNALPPDHTTILEGKAWQIRLAYDQKYLGRALIMAYRHVGSVSELTEDEWAELHRLIKRYESAITELFGARLFNWACLMNNAFKEDQPQPHVHWHVRPRYSHAVESIGRSFVDPN